MAEGKYALRPWLAEFSDPEVERDYRAEQFELQQFQVRLALFIWAGLWMLFLLDDLARVGFGTELGQLMLQRTVVAGAIVGFAALLQRRPALFTDSHGLASLMILGWTGFLLFYFQRPMEEMPWVFAMGMVMLVALFVFLPIRLPHALAVAGYSVIGTVIALHWSYGVDGVSLASAFAAMVVPMVTGIFVLYRLQASHRELYAMLRQAQEANVHLSHEVAIRRELEEELRRQATTDSLTGLFNRRHYHGLIGREIARSRRSGTPLSFCVLDIDHFKRVNDSYGHGAGDEVLRFLADLCRETARDTDILGRLGGEEFVIALPDTALGEALTFADRLRTRLEQATIVTENGDVRLTVTIGVAQLSEQDASLQDLVRRADEALYAGKQAGRNQVRAAA